MVGLSLGVCAAPASASVTLGQLAPSPGPGFCNGGLDRLDPSVTSGNSYTVPGDGTITSWSTNAGGNTGQRMTLKIFRKVSDPNTYGAVAHDGPRDLIASALNTFSTSISVQAGDLVGMHTLATSNSDALYCDFPTAGDDYLFYSGSLGTGESAAFTDVALNERLNISAVLVPSSAFTLGAVQRNKKHGIATLAVRFPGPGELVAAGNGLATSAPGAVQSTAVAGAGNYELTIRATGKKKAKLKRKGKVAVSPTLTYTPTGGAASTQTTSIGLKLKKRR